MDVSDRICAARGPKSFETGGIDKEYKHLMASRSQFAKISLTKHLSGLSPEYSRPVVSLVRQRQGASYLHPNLQPGRNADLSGYDIITLL